MAKKSNILDELEALPAGRSKSRTFMDDLTEEHRELMLEVRKRYQAGRVRASIKSIIAWAKSKGVPLTISESHLLHWLKKDG